MSALNGTSWAAIVFALATFLIVGVCTIVIFACCRACRKERQRQLVGHVTSETEAPPPLDKPPSYWRFFRTLSSIKISQPLEVGDGNTYVSQPFPGTPPPKYDDLGFIFDVVPKSKPAKDSPPQPVNEPDSAIDQGIFFTASTTCSSNPPESIMLDTISANPSTTGSVSPRPDSPPKTAKNNAQVWPTLETGDIPHQTNGTSTICLERSFRNLVSNNVSPGSHHRSSTARLSVERVDVFIDGEDYITRL